MPTRTYASSTKISAPSIRRRTDSPRCSLILFETQFRRKEIGLRKVYGATIGEILRMFNKRYMRIVLACSVVAIPAGWYVVDRWLESFAYRTPVKWWIFAVAVGSVALVTVLTITLQSYRTATENPVRSIKTE